MADKTKKSKKNWLRKQYVVNKKLQWGIAWQVIMTWVIGATVALIFPIAAVFICGMGFAGMSFADTLADVSKAYTFPALMAIVFMPIAIWHSFQFSNRIAGPMFRFGREIKTLLNGDSIKPIKLREKDYWHTFADDFNKLAAQMGKLDESGTKANKVDTPDPVESKEEEPELVNA